MLICGVMPLHCSYLLYIQIIYKIYTATCCHLHFIIVWSQYLMQLYRINKCSFGSLASIHVYISFHWLICLKSFLLNSTAQHIPANNWMIIIITSDWAAFYSLVVSSSAQTIPSSSSSSVSSRRHNQRTSLSLCVCVSSVHLTVRAVGISQD